MQVLKRLFCASTSNITQSVIDDNKIKTVILLTSTEKSEEPFTLRVTSLKIPYCTTENGYISAIKDTLQFVSEHQSEKLCITCEDFELAKTVCCGIFIYEKNRSPEAAAEHLHSLKEQPLPHKYALLLNNFYESLKANHELSSSSTQKNALINETQIIPANGQSDLNLSNHKHFTSNTFFKVLKGSPPKMCNNCKAEQGNPKSMRTSEEDSKEIWVCLHCGQFFCGKIKNTNSHVIKHFNSTKHNSIFNIISKSA